MKISKTSIVILVAFIGLIGFFIKAVQDKETTLKEGTLVLLELAPVDPRSLMQGDYMQLRYAMANTSTYYSTSHSRGYVQVKLDSSGVGQLLDVTSQIGNAKNDEIYIKYYATSRSTINIGAESFFFQEGQAEKFEAAKFGGIKVDKKGNSILIGLYDEHKKRIE